jgi:hypothetical protein
MDNHLFLSPCCTFFGANILGKKSLSISQNYKLRNITCQILLHSGEASVFRKIISFQGTLYNCPPFTIALKVTLGPAIPIKY